MSTRRSGSSRKKKGPTKGSGGQGRRKLEGRGPTPKASDRTWHKNYRPPAPKKKTERTTDAVAGRNPVVEALEAEVPASTLYVAGGVEMDDRIRKSVRLAADRGIPVLEATEAQLARITDNARHQGIALQVPPYEYENGIDLVVELMDDWSKGYRHKPPLVVALDSITDPHNLGAILRSASAFSADAVVIPSRRSVGVTSTVWKTSAGAAARVPVGQVSNLNSALTEYKKAGMFTIGLDGDGDQSLPGLPLATEPLCVVVGSEGTGLSRLVAENVDQIVSIPISSELESLNASLAAGITLYEIARLRAKID
ncbi:23S rRNA (guanosine(2251)-2'-O)-methyltransferase RlmB [Enteractinococcus helveticum]|uniref:23S rRNA (Guanosine(2251)-2'-O)-methyltransferase RlmB n=1 Tax=Enteractinococcus helveticum TaxID=1837282 RepID=A0A1B7M326_9MICC|nr:23S rRNA (guanosine(2251)-2'-O)-methyltransferase RlmB [Enteractinococcus helveticum]OAV62994.1 23S rRNA (guanosine(2251)-2'-O)-methyltransferase RlmB [Enteractinococcus helveticum]